MTGTVTVQPGRILGDRTLVIQDESGGIAVRLPHDSAADSLARGSIMRVTGVLADPYGNLELRPNEGGSIAIIGSGGLPEPLLLDAARIDEASEGSLATITATLVDVDRYDSGAISMLVRDDSGDARAYVFAPLELDPSSLTRGQRLRFTGIVGQRASRSGATDGHRLWPRGRSDIEVLDDGAATTPPPGGGADDHPVEPTPPRVDIGDATPGQIVTIVGVVTSKAGVVDSEGRRVTVEDKSGAMLVRYPPDVKPAAVGRVVRATGEVGSWYGASQLEAATKPRITGHANVTATTLRQPPGDEDVWRLVAVAVQIVDVERDGDTWRAEARLASGQTMPIVGLSGSGVDPQPLEPGRSARVTGIVRRAHPAATDQRLAIAPRSRKDLRFGPRVGQASGATNDGVSGDGGLDGAFAPAASGVEGATVLAVTLGSLDVLTDRMVRVGGRLEAVAGRRLTLEDGTGRGTVKLAQGVEPIDPALRVGEIVNAKGRVRAGRGGPEVVVDSAADVRRAAGVTYTAEVAGSRDPVPREEPSAMASGSEVLVPLSAGPDTTRPEPLPLVAAGGLAAAASLLLVLAGVVARRSRREPQPPTSG